jgi:hypothetical protein
MAESPATADQNHFLNALPDNFECTYGVPIYADALGSSESWVFDMTVYLAKNRLAGLELSDKIGMNAPNDLSVGDARPGHCTYSLIRKATLTVPFNMLVVPAKINCL